MIRFVRWWLRQLAAPAGATFDREQWMAQFLIRRGWVVFRPRTGRRRQRVHTPTLFLLSDGPSPEKVTFGQ